MSVVDVVGFIGASLLLLLLLVCLTCWFVGLLFYDMRCIKI